MFNSCICYINKGKSAIPPLFNGSEMLSSASVKAKLFAKIFSKISNLDDLGISLPVFLLRSNLKLHITKITAGQQSLIVVTSTAKKFH